MSLVIIELKKKSEQISEIGAILRRAGIRVDGAIREMAAESPGRVSVDIPMEHLVEALFTLDYYGFQRIRCYSENDSLDSTRQMDPAMTAPPDPDRGRASPNCQPPPRDATAGQPGSWDAVGLRGRAAGTPRRLMLVRGRLVHKGG
jgi:hypothetical protein